MSLTDVEVGNTDNDDLQALFDSVVAGSQSQPTQSVAEAVASTNGDSDDLQALFDSVQSERGTVVVPPSEDVVYNKLGKMTRTLHDTLRELGYEKAIDDVTKSIPDARDRLAYISHMTEQAVSRVLNATDLAIPLQTGLAMESRDLSTRWDKVFENALSPSDFKELVIATRNFLCIVPEKAGATNAHLTEIMMAQEFQDLIGQVIRKVTELTQDIEQQLVELLVETIPREVREHSHATLLNGPVITSEGRTDVVTSQAQVDDLLESLGF